ncbi:TPA: SLBB domain-containing protein, partial [Vibrio cholerae O1]
MIRGLLYAMRATGAKEGIIAIKGKHQAAIDILNARVPDSVRLHILPDVYPAGDEVITIWLATGRRVPPAALPLSVGVVVSNVQTLINVAYAVEQEQAVIHRVLTVNGAVHHPVTVSVPVGTTLREVLALAGGSTISNPAYINGGPMMGKLQTSLDDAVTKTTGGLLVLPDDHILIQRR